MSNNWSSPETADRMLCYLRELAQGSGHATCSFASAADDLGIGRNTAGNAVRRLLDTGEITVARMGTGRDYPTTYAVPNVRPRASVHAAA